MEHNVAKWIWLCWIHRDGNVLLAFTWRHPKLSNAMSVTIISVWVFHISIKRLRIVTNPILLSGSRTVSTCFWRRRDISDSKSLWKVKPQNAGLPQSITGIARDSENQSNRGDGCSMFVKTHNVWQGNWKGWVRNKKNKYIGLMLSYVSKTADTQRSECPNMYPSTHASINKTYSFE